MIMEGNSHPGALRGRISFRSFNPSIDRLHDEASNVRQMKESNINNQNGSSDSVSDPFGEIRTQLQETRIRSRLVLVVNPIQW